VSEPHIRYLVIAVDEGYGEETGACLVHWHEAGLVAPFLLVTPDGTLADRSPVRGRGPHAASRDPQTVLGSLGAEGATVLVLCGPRGASREVRSLVDRLGHAVANQAELHRLAVYAVPADYVGTLADADLDQRARNFALTLEDRVAPNAMNPAVADTPTPARLAFAGAAAAGALVGQSRTPVDVVSADQVTTVRFIRVFARLSVGPNDLLDDLSDRTEKIRQDAAEMARLVGGAPAAEPARVSALAARSVARNADGRAFRYLPYQPDDPPKPTRVTFRRALRMLWDFVRDFLTSAARDAVLGAVEKRIKSLEDRAQQLIFGPDSAYRIALLDDMPTTDRSTLAQAAEDLVKRDDPSVQIPAMPQAWQQVRATAFGLADAVPAFVDLPLLQNKRMVVTDPWLIAPLPTEPVEPVGDEIRACDPIAARALQSPQGSDDSAQDEPSQGGERDDRDNDVAEWLAQREDSFTWLLAGEIATSLDEAAADMIAATRQLADRMAPPTDNAADERARRKRRRRRMLKRAVIALALVAALVAPLILFLVGVLALLAYIIVQAVMFVLVVTRLLRRLARWVLARFQAEHRLLLEEYALAEAIQRSVHAAKEYAKLHSSYRQIVEWSDVIAEITHRPFGQPQEISVLADRATGNLGAPLAWVAGAGVVTQQSRARLAHAASAHAYVRGWISATFDRRAQHATQEQRTQREEQADDASLDADYDVGAQFGAIRDLAEQLKQTRQVDRAHLLSIVASELTDRPVTEVLDAITEDLHPDGTSPELFFAALAPAKPPPLDDDLQRYDPDDERPRGEVWNTVLDRPRGVNDEHGLGVSVSPGAPLIALAVRTDFGLELAPGSVGRGEPPGDDESHQPPRRPAV
jgi:hypothetical protein